MKHESVFEYQKKHKPSEVMDFVHKLKNSVTYVPLCVSLPHADAWLTVDTEMFRETWELGRLANAYETMVLGMNDFSRKLYLGTLQAQSVLDFESCKNKSIKNFDKSSDVSSLSLTTLKAIDGFKDIFNGSFKTPKTIAQCKAFYDSTMAPFEDKRPRKKVMKFHYFRDTPLPYGDRNDVISTNKGYPNETNIIKSMDYVLTWFYDDNLDPFMISGIGFFLLETILPFYHDNLYFSCSLISLYLSGYYPALASQITSCLLRNASLLHRSFQETLNAKNQGDLSHFLMVYEAVIKDGINVSSYQLGRMIEQEKNRLSSLGDHADDRIRDALVRADIYSLWGIDVAEILKEAQVSLPSLNRYIKKQKLAGHLVIQPIGKKHLLSLKE